MKTIGPYVVLGTLGQGGMGVVLRARGPDGREVAIKTLRSTEGDRLARFERERRLLAALGEAEGFVPLLDAGMGTQGPYIVMPLVPGGTLRDRLARGPLPLGEGVALARTLARALGAAHALGVVHRDLKPENVLFTADGRPLVADLGLAKHFDASAPGASQSISLSQHGAFRGTAGYAAPEQMASSREAGPESDVFALGAILHECLTGQPAFRAESVLDLFGKVASGDVAPLGPDVPAALAAVVRRALEVEARARYPDALAFGRALDAATEQPRGKSRGAIVTVVGVAAVVALALGAAALRVATPPAGPELDRAPAAVPAEATLAHDLDAILARAQTSAASVLVEDARSGERLFACDPERALPAATALQLVTTAAVAHRIPDAQLTTELRARGAGSSARLVLVGGGDPTLPVSELERFADAVQKRRITRVEELVVDARRFDPNERTHPGWIESLPLDLLYLRAHVSALTVNDGCFDVRRTPTGLAAFPSVAAMMLVPDELASSRVEWDGTRWIVRAGLPPDEGFTWWAPVPCPELLAGHVLREALVARGIEVASVRAAEPGEETSGAVAAARTTSATEVVAQVNRRSQGFYAECLLRTLGVEVRGAGTFAGGAAVVEEFARTECRVPPGELAVTDGSGLVATSRASARALAAVVRWATARPAFLETLNQLPASGNRIRPGRPMGFLSLRFAESIDESGVVLRFQHGTVAGATSFAGTIEHRERRWIVVALLRSSGPPGPARDALESLVRRLVAAVRR